MRRLSLCLAVAVAALVSVPVAIADGGPMFVIQGGTGVAHGSVRYVAASVYRANRTDLIGIASGGGVGNRVLSIPGQWGLPSTVSGAGGLSHDGRTLVLAQVNVGISSPSRFVVVDLRRYRVVRTIALRGSFSFDALSPDASRLYLIQYTHAAANDVTHYIVRAYDMRTGRLLQGKIADRSEDEKTMAGYPMTRTTSAGGRWVYTLYQKPSGMPFVHALDTVGAAAYCIDLPKNREPNNIVLSLRNGPDARRALAQRTPLARRGRRELADLVPGRRPPLGLGRRRDRRRPRGRLRRRATPAAPPPRGTPRGRPPGARARVA